MGTGREQGQRFEFVGRNERTIHQGLQDAFSSIHELLVDIDDRPWLRRRSVRLGHRDVSLKRFPF